MRKKLNLSGSEFDERRACLFTVKGELLWRSKTWTGGLRRSVSDYLVSGARWQEFVWVEDLPGVLAWFADDQESGIQFRALIPDNGKMMRLTFEKIRWCSGVWLVAGDAKPIEKTAPESASI